MPAKIMYKQEPIASVPKGQTATVECGGNLMDDNIIVINEGGEGDVELEILEVSENGLFFPHPTKDGFSQVSVSIPAFNPNDVTTVSNDICFYICVNDIGEPEDKISFSTTYGKTWGDWRSEEDPDNFDYDSGDYVQYNSNSVKYRNGAPVHRRDRIIDNYEYTIL